MPELDDSFTRLKPRRECSFLEVLEDNLFSCLSQYQGLLVFLGWWPPVTSNLQLSLLHYVSLLLTLVLPCFTFKNTRLYWGHSDNPEYYSHHKSTVSSLFCSALFIPFAHIVTGSRDEDVDSLVTAVHLWFSKITCISYAMSPSQSPLTSYLVSIRPQISSRCHLILQNLLLKSDTGAVLCIICPGTKSSIYVLITQNVLFFPQFQARIWPGEFDSYFVSHSILSQSTHKYCFDSFSSVGIKPRALHTVGMLSTSEAHWQPYICWFCLQNPQLPAATQSQALSLTGPLKHSFHWMLAATIHPRRRFSKQQLEWL